MVIKLRVQSCCCGTNLRTGTMIIGSLDFVGALATIIVASIAAVNAIHYNWWDDYYPNPMRDLRPMYITVAVFSSFLLIFDCLLLAGASQAKPKLILPWIFYAYVSLLLNFICAMIYGIYSLTFYYDSYGYLGISWSIIYLGVKLYFLLVVWSHYHQLLGGAGTTLNNGVQVTMYPTVPTGQQPFPNASQTYPNVQTQYPNIQMQYPNVQQPYPNVQVQQTFPNPQQPYPNSQQPYPNQQQPNPNPQQPNPNSQQPYPNPQQTYPNPQQPYPNPQQPYPNPHQPNPNPQQPYPNPQQPYPNPQQPYPNPQQPYPNPQQPYPNPQQPYPNPQPLPSMESMRRDI